MLIGLGAILGILFLSLITLLFIAIIIFLFIVAFSKGVNKVKNRLRLTTLVIIFAIFNVAVALISSIYSLLSGKSVMGGSTSMYSIINLIVIYFAIKAYKRQSYDLENGPESKVGFVKKLIYEKSSESKNYLFIVEIDGNEKEFIIDKETYEKLAKDLDQTIIDNVSMEMTFDNILIEVSYFPKTNVLNDWTLITKE